MDYISPTGDWNYEAIDGLAIVTQLTEINETLKAKNTDSGMNGGEKT